MPRSKQELIVVDEVEDPRAKRSPSRALIDPESAVTRVPQHRFKFMMTIIVKGELFPVSYRDAMELGCWASVSQTNGIVTNGSDRAASLVLVLPAGYFACIDLDNPDAVPKEHGSRRW